MLVITHTDIVNIALGDTREDFTIKFKEGIILYNEILELKDLNLIEKSILCCFMDDVITFDSGTSEINYSNKDIAELLHISENEVIEAMEKLHTLGYINIKRRCRKKYGELSVVFQLKNK